MKRLHLFRAVISPIKSKYTYRQSNYDYAILFDKYGSFDHLLHYYNNNVHLTQINTEKLITFKNGLPFGSNKKTINKLLGKPLVLYENPFIKNHSILFYKFLLGINKIKCEFHLYNDFFFLGMYIFDTFNNDFTFIKKQLSEKYLNQQVTIDTDMCIADPRNNKIFIDLQSFNPVITYVFQNSEFEKELIKFIGDKKLQLEQRTQKMKERLLLDL